MYIFSHLLYVPWCLLSIVCVVRNGGYMYCTLIVGTVYKDICKSVYSGALLIPTAVDKQSQQGCVDK